MKGKFTEVKGTAQDLANWHALLSSDDAPAFAGLVSIADPDDFAGRLRRNYLDHVTAALIQTRASEHTLRRAAGHIAGPRASPPRAEPGSHTSGAGTFAQPRTSGYGGGTSCRSIGNALSSFEPNALLACTTACRLRNCPAAKQVRCAVGLLEHGRLRI